MNEDEKARLDALHQKLEAVQARRAEPPKLPETGAHISFAGIAYRMVIEMAAGIFIGAAIGFGLDYLFGTSPWFLVVMTLFGFAAGIKVMMESAREFQAKQDEANSRAENEEGREGAPK